MLSYMLPVDEKPPPVSNNKEHNMQLTLEHEHLANGRTSDSISKETSISSFISDATTTASHSSMTTTSNSDKGKPKLIINGGKHQTLKRVSFGSSKGSMVETLIFESPLQEEPEPSPIPEVVTHPFPEDYEQTESEREKVRVTFFQQSKPQEVDLPDEPEVFDDVDFMMATATVSVNDSNHIVYNRTESTESGWENPFRPGGDLSREADEIVELIKGGKPITPTPGSTAPPLPSVDSNSSENLTQNACDTNDSPITQSPKKMNETNSINGNVKNDTKATAVVAKGLTATPGTVDVKRATVKPEGDIGQVEHVTIKKKPKCKCCVIQ